jgi:sec-independent protein translocase protein TatA
VGFEIPEILILLVLALILFGPDKLPEYGAKLGRFVARMRQASSENQPPPPPSPLIHENFCHQCGHTLEPDFTFCPRCGRRLEREGPSSHDLAS